MSDLFTAVADRLRGACPSAAQVTPAMAAVDAESMALGPIATVLVVPAAESWRPVSEAALQVCAEGRMAVTCVVGLTFPAGFGEWSTIRREIRAALLGWTPTIDGPEVVGGPFMAAGGRLLSYDPQEGGRWVHGFDFTLPIQQTYEHQ